MAVSGPAVGPLVACCVVGLCLAHDACQPGAVPPPGRPQGEVTCHNSDISALDDAVVLLQPVSRRTGSSGKELHRWPDLGDVRDIGSRAADAVVTANEAAVKALGNVVNATLGKADQGAEALLDFAIQARKDLEKHVNETVDKLAAFKKDVNDTLGIASLRWEPLVEATRTVVDAIAGGLSTIGYGSLDSKVNETLGKSLEKTDDFARSLTEARDIVEGGSSKHPSAMLRKLNATLENALGQVRSFVELFENGIQQFSGDVTEKINEKLGGKAAEDASAIFGSISGTANSTASTTLHAAQVLLGGIAAASAEMGVESPARRGAETGLSLVLALAVAAAAWAAGSGASRL